ncbi:Uncharacterised protein [Raoultella terrigena]|uniref:Uncharacterized protein n=1 Tax=Raoultella terrigena TaxID=577 RepID=A0A3P8M536_RAOTE|nr:Uncharacterised protein [Raoultella terrigena]
MCNRRELYGACLMSQCILPSNCFLRPTCLLMHQVTHKDYPIRFVISPHNIGLNVHRFAVYGS